MLQFSSSRMTAAGSHAGWKPSGAARLSFPIAGRLGGYLQFAAGTENFEYAEQIGQYSMRNWSAGLRIRLPVGQEILGQGHYRRYDNGRTAAGAGVSYVLRF